MPRTVTNRKQISYFEYSPGAIYHKFGASRAIAREVVRFSLGHNFLFAAYLKWVYELFYESDYLRGESMRNLSGTGLSGQNQEIAWNWSKSMAKIWLCATFLGVLVFSAGQSASAQTPTGSVVGTVKDSQGLAIQGADVTLTNEQTNYLYHSSTSGSGAYEFLSLDYGIYGVSVTREGFKSGVVQHIKLDASTQYSV